MKTRGGRKSRKIRRTRKQQQRQQRGGDLYYNQCLFRASGIDKTVSLEDLKEAEEALLSALETSFHDFVTRKQEGSEKPIFSDEEQDLMNEQYKNFMEDVQSHTFPDFRTKNNTICLFLAMLFEKYMLKNDYYLRKLQDITQKMQSKVDTFSTRIYKNIILPFFQEEVTTPLPSVLDIQQNERFNILFTDKKYFIRLHGSSLKTILTAFTKEVFFIGFKNKEVITHDGIVLPLAYITHDLIHYGTLNENYKTVNVEKLTEFLSFIENKTYAYHVYLILYLFMFENNCYDDDTVENYKIEIPKFDKTFREGKFRYINIIRFYSFVCAFLRFDVSKEDFTLITNKLNYYNTKYDSVPFHIFSFLMSEHFLMGLLPADIQNQMKKTEEGKEKLVINYFYTCMWTFFGYYSDFMFPELGQIPFPMRKKTLNTPCIIT